MKVQSLVLANEISYQNNLNDNEQNNIQIVNKCNRIYAFKVEGNIGRYTLD